MAGTHGRWPHPAELARLKRMFERDNTGSADVLHKYYQEAQTTHDDPEAALDVAERRIALATGDAHECLCCGGSGIQEHAPGSNSMCPECRGRGVVYVKEEAPNE